MKIAQINTVCGSGSVGRITVDIFHALKKKGWDGRIYYGRKKAPETVDAVKFGTGFDMGNHVLHTFLEGTHGFSSGKQTERLVRALETYNPDLIHLHNIHGFYLDVEKLFEYLKRCGKPVVWTLHDCWAFTGHCSYFDYVQCGKWKTGCGACVQHKNVYPYALFKDGSAENYLRKKAAFAGVKGLTIVTPSRWLADLVKESFLKDYPVRIIPNGIDLNIFRPGKKTEKEKYLVLGAANVWDRRKGLDYIKELARQLDPQTYEVAAVGLSRKQIKELPEKMRGICHTQNAEELADLYREADVYVNPTLEDNFPTTNLEALACGTPVVTFDTGGSAESVTAECGRIVSKGDFQGLADAVRKICETEKISQETCRARALLYDKYDRFGEYIKLYEESINYYDNL